MTTPQGMLDKGACETPMRDHVERFWKYLETETVRILVDMRRDTSSVPYWDSSSFSDAVAKALVADRRQAAAPQGREALEACRAYLVELTKPPRVGPFVGVISSGHPCHALIDKIDKALTPAVAPDGAEIPPKPCPWPIGDCPHPQACECAYRAKRSGGRGA